MLVNGYKQATICQYLLKYKDEVISWISLYLLDLDIIVKTSTNIAFADSP